MNRRHLELVQPAPVPELSPLAQAVEAIVQSAALADHWRGALEHVAVILDLVSVGEVLTPTQAATLAAQIREALGTEVAVSGDEPDGDMAS